MSDTWLDERTADLEEFAGHTIDGWHGVEIPDGSCLRLAVLYVTLGDHVMAFTTCEQHDAWGLIANACAAPDAGCRELPELPTGEVRGVAVTVEDGIIAEVELRVGETSLLLIAGEAYGETGWHRYDESVLVFTDPAAADRMTWTPARAPVNR